MANFNLNEIRLAGRLTANPEIKTTSNGMPNATFTIAVNRDTKQGQEQQTDFFRCRAWSKTAENIGRYFAKGNTIYISGKAQNNNWTDQQGVKHYSTDIIVDNFRFVESRVESRSESADSDLTPAQENQNRWASADLQDVGDEGLPF